MRLEGTFYGVRNLKDGRLGILNHHVIKLKKTETKGTILPWHTLGWLMWPALILRSFDAFTNILLDKIPQLTRPVHIGITIGCGRWCSPFSTHTPLQSQRCLSCQTLTSNTASLADYFCPKLASVQFSVARLGHEIWFKNRTLSILGQLYQVITKKFTCV